MANLITRLADLVLPTSFGSYVAENSTIETNLFKSGAVRTVPGLAITKGAKLTVPFVTDLTGRPVVLADNTALETKKIGSGVQHAVVNSKGDAFSVNLLAQAYTGEDLVGYIASRVAAHWEREFQTHTLEVLEGVFASSSMAGVVTDVTAATGGADKFSLNNFLTASYKLLSARGKVALLAAHPLVVAEMERQDAIQYIPNSTGGVVRVYRGLPIIEDEALIDGEGVATIYGLAAGSIGFAEGLDLISNTTEYKPATDDVNLYTRRSFVIHPMGLSFLGDVGANGQSPAASVLKDGTKWVRTTDIKNVPMFALKVNI
jgi:hypothetical protein